MIVFQLFEVAAVLGRAGPRIRRVMYKNIFHFRQGISRSGIFIHGEKIFCPVGMCCIYIRRKSLDPGSRGLPDLFFDPLHSFCRNFHRSTGFRSAGRYFQQIFQHKDSCKNAGTQQGNLNISVDSCLSAAALPPGSDPALSDAGAVSIVFVNILLICIARMTLLLPPGLVFLLCCRRILRM